MNRNRFITLGLTSFALLGVPTALSISHPQVVQASTGYASKTSHSITYSNKTGKMTINKVVGIRGYENTRTEDDKRVASEIIFTATFTNKTGHRVSPEFFMQDHFDIKQYYEGSWRSVVPTSPLLYAPTHYYSHLSNNGEDDVAGHQTVTIALSDDNVRPIYKHELIIVRAKNDSAYGKALATKRFRLNKLYNIDVNTGKTHKFTKTDTQYIMVSLRGMFGRKYPKGKYIIISHSEYKKFEKDLAKGNLFPSYIKSKLKGRYYTQQQALNRIDELEGNN